MIGLKLSLQSSNFYSIVFIVGITILVVSWTYKIAYIVISCNPNLPKQVFNKNV